MLNRRIIRIKVMQALYAFFQSQNDDIEKGEELLFKSFEAIYDLYLYILSFFIELQKFSQQKIEEAKLKFLPTYEDIHPNTKFIDNRYLKRLSEDIKFQAQLKERNISWNGEEDIIKNIFQNIKESKIYKRYMNSPDNNYQQDKDFVVDIFINRILKLQLLDDYLEDKDIFWSDAYDMVASQIIKTIHSFDEEKVTNPMAYGEGAIFSLYKDYENDSGFARDLFRKTILNSAEYEKIISQKAEHWEKERIVFMDMLLMKMAVCEFLEFPTIPIRATMDEYIDISKYYSTTKSSYFINGILDKIIKEFQKENKIDKIGRGLVEK